MAAVVVEAAEVVVVRAGATETHPALKQPFQAFHPDL